ncbi:chemokine-like protein TAFA-5 isoform X1 [Mauremys mutica]|uniref:chemokine-like protein TAFA-5 isoform X1 n=1 Tax=Mauremys reevesii TaxID=260615 RepID=UPI00193F9FC7|nr:chemokine-like protein TAFA-5 isoform X1 [Mauremys reevesii]XP_044872408.1 chemokine-like protein TAFA-5 isoform X1 [Mauremys mutica]
MLAGWREISAGIGATLCCLLFFWLLYSHPPKEGKELEVGTCEITALNRDLSHPRRMIARQTARCACRRGQVAGTTRAKPACVDAQLIASKQWCGMEPCDEGEQCTLLINRSGWSCSRRLGRIKTVTRVRGCRGDSAGEKVLRSSHLYPTGSPSALWRVP